MNAIFFRAKRAFHATLHLTRKLLAAEGITAARFDMLKALEDPTGQGFRQSDLRDLLGVTAPTISRMLRSLEKLGWIVRERMARDRRRLIVRVTVAGHRLFRRISKRVIESGAIQLAVDCALAGPNVDEGDCLEWVETAEIALLDIEAAFHRRAYLSYPWHPDD